MLTLPFWLAARNLIRNRERSLLTLIGVLLAIGSFVALVSLAEGLNRRIDQELDHRNVDIYVVPRRAQALPSGPIGTIGYSQETMSQEVLQKISEMPNVARVAGVNRDNWSGRRTILPVVFLDVADIRAFFPRLQGVPDELGPQDILLGSGLAAQEGAGPGSVIPRQQTQYTVKGLVQGGGFQDYFAFVQPRSDSGTQGYQEGWIQLQDKALAIGNAQEINANLLSGGELVALTRQQYLTKSHSLAVYAWLLQASIASIGVLIAITASMNTMLMSTYERLREFAVLRAIGASRGTVAMMLLWESVMLSCVGGILGCLFGVLASGVLDRAVVVLLQLPFPLARVTLWLILQSMGLAVAVGVVGAAIPLILVWRQKIMDGLRSE